MRHGDEQAQVMEWLYARLRSDAPLADAIGVPLVDLDDRVWPDAAPDGTRDAWVVYSATEGRDRNALGAHARLGSIVPVNVRVVTTGHDPGRGAAANRRLYALLQGNHNTPVSDGGVILTCRRTSPLSYPENAGGIDYYHTGGLYEAEVN